MIKYPLGFDKSPVKSPSFIKFENRGMAFEKEINDSNKYYLENDIAAIYKKPTPIKVVKIDEKEKHISLAYFESPSTTDYNGIYKSKYIDFEAKSTVNPTSFSLSNINENQINHLRKIIKLKGIAFLFVYFSRPNKYFLLKATDLISFLDTEKRKSIPITYFMIRGIEVKRKIKPLLPYLSALDSLFSL